MDVSEKGKRTKWAKLLLQMVSSTNAKKIPVGAKSCLAWQVTATKWESTLQTLKTESNANVPGSKMIVK